MVPTDSLLAQCTIRAQNVTTGEAPTFRGMGKTMALSGRCVALVVNWALAMDALGMDDLTPADFIAWSQEPRRSVYDRLTEFRRLWPEYESPNELAHLVLAHSRRKPSPGTQIPVVA